jgi:hypothetical protein
MDGSGKIIMECILEIKAARFCSSSKDYTELYR